MLVGSCVVRMVVVCNLHSEAAGSNSVDTFCWVFGSSKVGLCIGNHWIFGFVRDRREHRR